MTRKNIGDKDRTEENFKDWVVSRKSGNSEGTAKTYWTQIRNIPYFHIIEEPTRLIRTRIKGAVDKEHKLSSIRQFIEYQYERHDQKIREGGHSLDYLLQHFDHEEILEGVGLSEDASITQAIDQDDIKEEDVRDIIADILETKKKSIRNIELKQSEKGDDDKPNIKYHYIHKDHFTQLLKAAEPRRAKFWLLTYLLGTRYGEVKRIQWSDVNLDYGEHGKVDIPDEKSKSKEERQIKLHSELTPLLLEDIFAKSDSEGHYGNWTDDSDSTWNKVCFPKIKQSKVNYELGKEIGDEGDKKQYGLLLRETDMTEPRTMHSLRHTRISDLIKAENRSIEYVGDRSGHVDYTTTQHYTETTFRRPPKSIEQHIDEEFGGDYERFRSKVIQYEGGVS